MQYCDILLLRKSLLSPFDIENTLLVPMAQ